MNAAGKKSSGRKLGRARERSRKTSGNVLRRNE
jgi:hypothetical protein